jgi:hypothetical protein
MGKENLMPLKMAVREVQGEDVKSSTIWNWHKIGVSGVKLQVTRVGNKLFTSVEAVRRFKGAIENTDRANRHVQHIPRVVTGKITEEQATPTAVWEIENVSARTLAQIKTPVLASVLRVLLESICNEYPNTTCRQVGNHLVLEKAED